MFCTSRNSGQENMRIQGRARKTLSSKMQLSREIKLSSGILHWSNQCNAPTGLYRTAFRVFISIYLVSLRRPRQTETRSRILEFRAPVPENTL